MSTPHKNQEDQAWFNGDEMRCSPETLRAELRFASAVLDTVGALVIVLDRQGRIVRFNRACEKTLGYALEEVKGKPLWDLILAPEEAKPLNQLFKDLRAETLPGAHENVWLTRDGKRRRISWSNTALPDEKGLVEYVIVSGIDITERKPFEDSQQHLAALVEASDDAIYGRNLDNIVVSWNPGAERMFGYAAEEALGQPMSMLLPAERAGETGEIMERIMQGERIKRFETVRIMIERVNLFSGNHEIKSAPGEDTIVKMVFPALEAAPEDENNG